MTIREHEWKVSREEAKPSKFARSDRAFEKLSSEELDSEHFWRAVLLRLSIAILKLTASAARLV